MVFNSNSIESDAPFVIFTGNFQRNITKTLGAINLILSRYNVKEVRCAIVEYLGAEDSYNI